MTTLSTIVTRVQEAVIDLPTSVTNRTQTLVEERINELMTLHNFDFMERRFGLSTTAGNPSLGTIQAALTAGGATGKFKEYHPSEPPFYTDDSGQTWNLVLSFNEHDVRRQFNQSTTYGLGRPRVLLHRHGTSSTAIEAAELKVYPIPDGLANTSDGEYTIQIPYYYMLPTSTNDTWLTRNATDFLVAAATSQAFLLDHDEVRYGIWQQVAYGPLWAARGIPGGHLKTVLDRDKGLHMSAVKTMVPYAGVNEPRLRL